MRAEWSSTAMLWYPPPPPPGELGFHPQFVHTLIQAADARTARLVGAPSWPDWRQRHVHIAARHA
jgi:hypothetical protein